MGLCLFAKNTGVTLGWLVEQVNRHIFCKTLGCHFINGLKVGIIQAAVSGVKEWYTLGKVLVRAPKSMTTQALSKNKGRIKLVYID